MSTADYQLWTPPTDPRERELWLQHVAGFILFQDMRDYARQQIDPSLTHEARVNMDVLDGDGMCMGYHEWRDNDFGETMPFVSS